MYRVLHQLLMSGNWKGRRGRGGIVITTQSRQNEGKQPKKTFNSHCINNIVDIIKFYLLSSTYRTFAKTERKAKKWRRQELCVPLYIGSDTFVVLALLFSRSFCLNFFLSFFLSFFPDVSFCTL